MATDSSDSERFDAQRKALSALMARFTADRDSLITSIHECQQQLSTIAGRLDTGQVSSAPQLDDLRRVIERMQLDQRQAAAQVGDLSAHELITRFTTERDAQAEAIRKCEEQLAALTTRLETSQSHDLPQLEFLRQQVEALQQEQQRAEAAARRAAEQALERATEAVGRIDALATAQQQGHASIEEATARLTTDRAAVSQSLRECQEQIDALAARLDSGDATRPPPLEQLRQLIEDSVREQHVADTDARAAAEQALACATDALRRIDEATAHTARPEDVESLAELLAAERDTLGGAISACQLQLAALTTRLDSSEAASIPALDELRGLVEVVQQRQEAAQRDAHALAEQALARASSALQALEATQSEQQRAQAEARTATDEALAQAQLACRRIDDAMATHTARHDHVEGLATRLAAEHTALDATVRGYQQQLQTLSEQLNAAAASHAPELTEVRQLVETLGQQQQAGDSTARTAAEHALARAGDALQRIEQIQEAQRHADAVAQSAVETALTHAVEARRRIDEVTASEDARHATLDDLVLRTAAEQEALRGALGEYEQQLNALAVQLSKRRTEAPDLAEVRQLVHELQQTQQQKSHEARAAADAALVRANDAINRIEEVTAAQQARHAGVETLASQLAAERATLTGALGEYQHQLDTLAMRVAAGESSAVPQFEDIRRRLEQIEAGQQQADVAANRALAQASEAVNRVEELATLQASHHTNVDDLATQLSNEHATITSALHEQQQHLGALSARVAANEENTAPQLDDVRRHLQQVDEAQRRSEAEVRAEVQQALQRSGAAIERIEAVAATQQTHVDELGAHVLAEREGLSSALREYQQQLRTLTAQLEHSQANTEPQLHELRQWIEQFQSEQRSAATDTRTAAEQAVADVHHAFERIEELRQVQQGTAAEMRTAAERSLERADDALRRINEVAAAQLAGHSDVEALAARLAADLETLGGALQAFQQQLAILAGRLESSQASIAPQLEGLQRAIEQVREEHLAAETHTRTAVEQALGTASDAVRRIEEVAATQLGHQAVVHDLATCVASDRDALNGALREYQEHVAALAARVEASHAQVAPQLEELRQAVQQLQQDQQSTATEGRAAVEHALARADEALQLIEHVQHAHERAEAAREAAEAALARAGEASRRIDEVTASQDTRHATLDNLVLQTAAEQEELRGTLQAYEQQLSALAAQLNQRGVGAAELTEVRRLIHEIEQAQQQENRETRTVADTALARTSEAANRVAELATLQDSHRSSVGELTTQLSSEQTTLANALHEQRQHLEALSARVVAGEESITPQLDDVRRYLQQVDEAQRRSEAEVRAEVQQALQRSGAAIEHIEAVAATQQTQQAHVDELGARLVAEREGLSSALREYQQQLRTLATQLEQSQANTAPQLHQLQQLVAQFQAEQRSTDTNVGAAAERALTEVHHAFERIDELRQVQQRTAAEARAAAEQSLECAGEALRRIDEVAAAQHAGHADTEALAIRLTADLGTLGGALRVFQQQLATLAGQLESSQASFAPQLEGLQQVIEQIREEHQTADTHTRAAVDQALGRASDAVRRIEEVAATQLGHQAIVHDLATCVASDRDALSGALREYQEHVSGLAARLEVSQTQVAPQLEELHQAVQQLRQDQQSTATQGRAAVEQALARAGETQRHVEDIVAAQQARLATAETLVVRVAADRDTLGTALADYRQQLDGLAARVDTDHARLDPQLNELREDQQRLRALATQLERSQADTAPQLQELQQLVVRSQAEQRAADTQARAAVEEALSRADQAQRHVEDIVAAQQARLATAETLVVRVTADRDTLGAALTDCRQQLDSLAARVDARDANLDPQLNELRNHIEQTQEAVRRAESEARTATGQALAQASDALHRIAAVTTEQHTQSDKLDGLAARLTTERVALGRSLQDCQQQIEALAAQLQTTELASRPQVEELQRHIQQAQLDQRLAHSQARAAADQALARAGEAMHSVEELTAAHRNRDEATTAVLARLSTERDALSAALHDSEQQHAVMSARLDQLQLDARLGAVQARATAEQALSQASDATRCVEELTSALRSREESTERLAARVNVDRDAFSGAIEASRQQIGALTARLDEHHSDTAQRLSDVRRWAEQTLQEQAQVAVQSRATAEQALSRADGAWQRIDELAAARQAEPDTATEIQLLHAQADRLAASLSRLDARVEQMAGTAPRRTPWEVVEPLPVPDSIVPAFAVPRRLWPAFAAVALILATVGTVALVTPRDVPAWRELVARWTRTQSAPPPAMPAAPSSDAFTRGLDALRRSDLAAAEQAFNEVVAAQPDAVEARNNLAVVLVEQRRFTAAAEQLRAALMLRPDYQRARTNLDMVEAVLARQNPPQAPSGLQPPAAPSEPHAADARPPSLAAVPAAPAGVPQPPTLKAAQPPSGDAPVAKAEPLRICGQGQTTDGSGSDGCQAVAPAPEQPRAARRSHRRRHVSRDLEPPADFASDLP